MSKKNLLKIPKNSKLVCVLRHGLGIYDERESEKKVKQFITKSFDD
jgi:hypothetical protein